MRARIGSGQNTESLTREQLRPERGIDGAFRRLRLLEGELGFVLLDDIENDVADNGPDHRRRPRRDLGQGRDFPLKPVLPGVLRSNWAGSGARRPAAAPGGSQTA